MIGSGYDPETRRAAAKRIASYNHKGGVGKTTLTVNIAQALANLGRRVLLVDSDPQCNLTSYLLDDDSVDDLLSKSDSDRGRTVWSSLKPIFENSAPAVPVIPQELPTENLFLIPGDIQLSKFEIELQQLWLDSYQRKPRGYNGTVALSRILNTIAETYKFDYIFYDCGPNVGPLNRVILLDCDYFIVPGACDMFSVRALRTLGFQLAEWIQDWRTIELLSPAAIYRMPGHPALLGYIPQRFKMYRSDMTSAYRRYLPLFEKELQRSIVSVLRELDPSLVPFPSSNLMLGTVRDFGRIAAIAQEQGRPLQAVDAPNSGPLRDEAAKVFRSLARKVERRTEGVAKASA
jgi:cellulose biosynthesis protein BcsQ